MNGDGTNVRQITHNTLWDEGPAWSPDSKQFAFSSGAGDLTLDMPQPLRVRAGGGIYATIPAALVTYGGPVSNDPVAVGFKQPIAATDALRYRDLREDADVHAVDDGAMTLR